MTAGGDWLVQPSAAVLADWSEKPSGAGRSTGRPRCRGTVGPVGGDVGDWST
jgi:hypothetical protein